MPTDFWEEDGSAEPQKNRLGTAGFVLSILGILTCGVLSPIALIVSLMGLSKEPKATAKGGTFLSAMGCILLGATIYFGTPFLTATYKEAEILVHAMEAGQELQNEVGDASKVSKATRSKILSSNLDPWQREFSFTQLEGEFELCTAGADGEFDSDDDRSWIFPNISDEDTKKVRKGR